MDSTSTAQQVTEALWQCSAISMGFGIPSLLRLTLLPHSALFVSTSPGSKSSKRVGKKSWQRVSLIGPIRAPTPGTVLCRMPGPAPPPPRPPPDAPPTLPSERHYQCALP
eukprot:11517581-Ditylum_brightwellii.AAC.1